MVNELLLEVEDAEEYIRNLVKQMAPDASGTTSTLPANSSAKSKPNKLLPVIKCPLCIDKHNLVRCQPFAHYDVDKRNKFVWEK